MKTQDKQILQLLQAFDPEMVMKAFEIYKETIEGNKNIIQEELKKEGWVPQKNKPEESIPSYFIDNLYWVLSEKVREEKIRNIKKATAHKTKSNKKEDVDELKKVQIKCPFCDSKMYKQKICPKCLEGKKGFKIRLICENNPDHEILL